MVERTKNPEIAERIRRAIAGSGKPKVWIAEQLGVSAQAVTGWERTGRIAKETVARLAALVGVSLERLMTGAESGDGFDEIVGYTHGASMGDGSTAEEYAETHKFKFRADSLRRKGLDADALKVYYGDGDSMEPTIEHEDAIMFDTRDTTPRDDSIFVLESTDGTIAKRLRNYGGRWFVVSDNKDDPKWRDPVPLDDKRRSFQIVGRVRWIARWKD